MDAYTRETLETIIAFSLHSPICTCDVLSVVNNYVNIGEIDEKCPFGRAVVSLKVLPGRFSFIFVRNRQEQERKVLNMSLSDFGPTGSILRAEANSRAIHVPLHYLKVGANNGTPLDLWLKDRGFRLNDVILITLSPLPAA